MGEPHDGAAGREPGRRSGTGPGAERPLTAESSQLLPAGVERQGPRGMWSLSYEYLCDRSTFFFQLFVLLGFSIDNLACFLSHGSKVIEMASSLRNAPGVGHNITSKRVAYT